MFAALCHYYHEFLFFVPFTLVSHAPTWPTLTMFDHGVMDAVSKSVSRSYFFVHDITSYHIIAYPGRWTYPKPRRTALLLHANPTSFLHFPSSYQLHCIIIVYRYRIAKNRQSDAVFLLSSTTITITTTSPLHPPCRLLLLCTPPLAAYLAFDCLFHAHVPRLLVSCFRRGCFVFRFLLLPLLF